MGDPVHIADNNNVHTIAQFLSETLDELEAVDARLHVLRDHFRSRLCALRLVEEEEFQRRVEAAEKAVGNEDLGPMDSPDTLRRRLDDLLATS